MSTKRPPVSVVLLNYNHGRFLGEALGAMAAALGPDDELLAFDDASQDDSVDIYRQHVAKIPQMRLFLKERNQGALACANEGMAEARHAYVYCAAADDRVDPELFDHLMTLLGQYPSAGIACCRSRIMDEDGRPAGMIKTPMPLTEPGYLSPEEAKRAYLADDNWVVGAAAIYRRDALLEAGGFMEELSSFADGFASRAVAFRNGACYSPAVLINWRRMEQGFSSAESANQKKTLDIADRATRLMTGRFAGIFPPGYAALWRRRWIFGTTFYGWRQRQAKRWSKDGRPPSRLARAAMLIERMAVGAALLLYYRPGDIPRVVTRNLGYLFGSGRDTAQ